MTITGLFYLPVSPSNSSSPSAAFVTQLSNKYPTQPHKPYHLDHRLYVDTSSLLPHATTNSQSSSSAAPTNGMSRHYTHLLTTSHVPMLTIVGTTARTDVDGLVMITISTDDQEGFTQLLNMKMQAQWAHRQSLILEGVSVELPLTSDEPWTVRVGDLKSAGTGLTRAAGGSGLGGVRAVLVEVQYSRDMDSDDQRADQPSLETYEDILRGFLKKLFQNVTEFNFEDARGLVRRTGEEAISSGSPDKKGKFPGWDLATLYMEVLRGTRG